MKNRKVSKKITAIIAVAAMMVSFFAIHATADGIDAPASGYAAVGIVDAEAHKAEVLLGTGQQGTVIFAGEAPAAGAVYSYTRNALNVYTFTVPNANHGNSNQLVDTGWNFWSEKNGWLWNANTQIYYPGTNPIFFRFGENQWAVTIISNFEGDGGASHMLGYALDASESGGSFYPGAFVFGGMGSDGSIDKTGYNVMVPSLTATNNLSTFTNDLHEIVLEAGYAAIGAIDSDNSLVEILKGTGEQGYVSFTGTAPVTGGVYRYTRNEANVYTFIEPNANHGNSKVHDASAAAWQMWMSENYGCYMWDGALNHYWPTSTTPVFARKSATTWVLTTSACFTNDASVMAYQLDAIRRGDSSYFDVGAIVFGGLKTDGTIDTTGFDQLKLPETSVDLSALTTALHPAAEESDPSEPSEPSELSECSECSECSEPPTAAATDNAELSECSECSEPTTAPAIAAANFRLKAVTTASLKGSLCNSRGQGRRGRPQPSDSQQQRIKSAKTQPCPHKPRTAPLSSSAPTTALPPPQPAHPPPRALAPR